MKQKLLIVLFFLFVASPEMETKAQGLVIKMKDGTEIIKQLGTFGKFSFSDNKLIINYSSGPIDYYNLSGIGKLYFKSTYTGTRNVKLNKTAGNMTIYPNPVREVINIQNAPSGTNNVFIYRIDGVMVRQMKISSDVESLNVSDLSDGIYFLKINNQAFRFVKL